MERKRNVTKRVFIVLLGALGAVGRGAASNVKVQRIQFEYQKRFCYGTIRKSNNLYTRCEGYGLKLKYL